MRKSFIKDVFPVPDSAAKEKDLSIPDGGHRYYKSGVLLDLGYTKGLAMDLASVIR